LACGFFWEIFLLFERKIEGISGYIAEFFSQTNGKLTKKSSQGLTRTALDSFDNYGL
jgi:hypothetical protein